MVASNKVVDEGGAGAAGNTAVGFILPEKTVAVVVTVPNYASSA